MKHARERSAFVLFEVMVAVAIFALGVITLGRCVSAGLAAERFRFEDARARRALENRVAEIEAGAVAANEPLNEKLRAPFAGLTLEQSAAPLKKFNEHKEELTGLLAVTLRVSWPEGNTTASRALTFYLHPREN